MNETLFWSQVSVAFGSKQASTPMFATAQPDNVPDREALAPYALTVAPKKSPTNTPTMNFAINLAPLGQAKL